MDAVFQWNGDQPAVFNYTFSPDSAFIMFFDSDTEPPWKFVDEHFAQGMAKHDGGGAFFITDVLDVPTSFHFDEDFPDPAEAKWSVVVEGLINLESGQLSFGSGTNWEELAISLPAGVYRFRAYAGVVDYENQSEEQEVRFYFVPTTEQEHNDITVLKRGG